MTPLASYIRHLIVTGILYLFDKFQLPAAGAKEAADYIALTIVLTLSWVFVKYIAPKIKIPKGSGVALFAIAACLALSNVSCTTLDVMVDKSQLKYETDTHAIYPSSAVSPVVNADAVNAVIQEQLDAVNEIIVDATK